MVNQFIATICLIVSLTVAQAKPLEYDELVNKRLLQELSKHSNSELLDKLNKASLLLREPLYGQPYNSFTNENFEAHQINSPELNAIRTFSPLEYLQAVQALQNDYEPSEDYYQPEQTNDETVYYPEEQEGWFEGPVLPKADKLVDNDIEDKVNKMIFNYLYDQYAKKINEFQLKENSENLNGVEKRRQKVVIKDDAVEVSSASPIIVSSTTSNAFQASSNKVLHKSPKTYGQKEVPLFRPAESKPKEWPSELEEDFSEEEESLKELQHKGQSRPTRDVLTSQLDNLKKETKFKNEAIGGGGKYVNIKNN